MAESLFETHTVMWVLPVQNASELLWCLCSFIQIEELIFSWRGFLPFFLDEDQCCLPCVLEGSVFQLSDRKKCY